MTGQTSHWVIGTCGSATTFAPCPLVASDLVFGSGGGTSNFLRADGTWAVPSGANNLADPGGNGFVVRTALNTTTNRTITVTSPLTISNPTGVAGNPLLALTNIPVTLLNSGTLASSSTFWRGDGTWGTPLPVTLTTIASSATPVFPRSTQIQEWTNALTTNISSSTTSGLVAGDVLIVNFTDAAGGHTVSWPTGFSQAATVSLKANGSFTQTFYWNGSNAIPIGPAITNESKFVNPPTSTDPGCTTANDLGGQWMDSTSSVTTHFKVCANVASTPAWVQIF